MAEEKPQDDCQEYILYDVLDVIFRHLSLKSLCNVALVSRSWHHAAMREIAKRSTMRRVLLPVPRYDVHENKQQEDELPEFVLDDYFAGKPDTVLMFCGPKPCYRSVLSLEYRIMGTYHKRIPGRMVMLGVEKVMMDAQEVRCCELPSFCSDDKSIRCNSILGLCLPDSKDITIRVAECVSHEKDTRHKAQKIFDALHEEAVDNPIFLLFSRYDYSIGSHVLSMFRQKYAGKPVSVWGSTIADFIKRSDDGYPSYRGTHGFLGILLHGPRLRAHCLVVPINLDGPIAERLAEFRRGIKLGRRSVGLACAPRVDWRFENESRKFYYSEDLMKMVKHEFPGVDFSAMFSNSHFNYYGCDHTSKTADYSLEHKNALSIMILTYD